MSEIKKGDEVYIKGLLAESKKVFGPDVVDAIGRFTGHRFDVTTIYADRKFLSCGWCIMDKDLIKVECETCTHYSNLLCSNARVYLNKACIRYNKWKPKPELLTEEKDMKTKLVSGDKVCSVGSVFQERTETGKSWDTFEDYFINEDRRLDSIISTSELIEFIEDLSSTSRDCARDWFIEHSYLKEEKIFQPVTISITLSTQEDINAFRYVLDAHSLLPWFKHHWAKDVYDQIQSMS